MESYWKIVAVSVAWPSIFLSAPVLSMDPQMWQNTTSATEHMAVWWMLWWQHGTCDIASQMTTMPKGDKRPAKRLWYPPDHDGEATERGHQWLHKGDINPAGFPAYFKQLGKISKFEKLYISMERGKRNPTPLPTFHTWKKHSSLSVGI